MHHGSHYSLEFGAIYRVSYYSFEYNTMHHGSHYSLEFSAIYNVSIYITHLRNQVTATGSK